MAQKNFVQSKPYTHEQFVSWLEENLSSTNFQGVESLPLSYLESIYPNIGKYGPQADYIETVFNNVLEDVKSVDSQGPDYVAAKDRLQQLVANPSTLSDHGGLLTQGMELIEELGLTALFAELHETFQKELRTYINLAEPWNISIKVVQVAEAVSFRKLLWSYTYDNRSTSSLLPESIYDDFTSVYRRLYGPIFPEDKTRDAPLKSHAFRFGSD